MTQPDNIAINVAQEKMSETMLGAVERLLSQRTLSSQCFLAIAIVSISLALCLYHLYAAYFGQVEAHIFRSTHLTIILVLTFLLYPIMRKEWYTTPNWGLVLDLVCIALAIAIEVYILHDYEAFCNRIADANALDSIVGVVLVLLVLEATRRTVGIPMLLVCIASVGYALYADHLYGILEGPPVSFHRLFSYMLMEDGGIFGIPIMAMASFIVLFLIFGAMLMETGASQFFLNLALALTGRRVGGPAKAAVVSSMLMGSISGSCVANVVTTGSFTIPLMKRMGYSPIFAGAVEAVASTGGQFMPPVMGAAGFIIAAFLGVTYLEVIIAALVPAIFFYISLYFMVHFESKKIGLMALYSEELPSLRKTLSTGWQHLISLIIIVTIIVLGYSVSLAAFWGIASVFILSFFSREKRITPVGLLTALGEAARTAIPVSIACAAAGLIIGAMSLSGFSLRLSSIVISTSGGHLWLILFFTMIMCLILGMGVPTTAVYVVVSAVIAPVLVQMGIKEMGAHLFAFYFGVISAITPPVCLAAFAAAGIAKSKPMSTGYMAARIGIAAYIVPFIFVFNPALLLIGSFAQIMYTILISGFVIFCLASGAEGWHIRKASLLERIVLVSTAIIFLKSSYFTHFVGLSLLTVVLIKGGAHRILMQKLSMK